MINNQKKLIVSTLTVVIFLLLSFLIGNNTLKGVSIWGTVIFLFFVFGKKSCLQSLTIDNPGKTGYISIIVSCIILILLCAIPMNLSPFWNGQIPMHRNQYELLADSMLNGHIYIDYEVDPKLLAMDNPYDYEERIRQEINYHYDHAFYNGHYYMYFGVVPVIFLFIPFKLIFGKTLVTFHATQFFVMFAIVAFFLLFYLLAKKYFKTLPVGTYIITSMAVCLITIGYCTQAPALYCTAISSGIFFMLWSLVFFFYAVNYAKKENVQVILAVLGALFGALAFGCRPPVALANLLAIPLAITYAKEYKGRYLIRNFILIVIPYVIVAALLMLYNYVRFENPFEFGQAYQLTTYDQSSYVSFLNRVDIPVWISGLFENFLTFTKMTNEFPYFSYGGVFVTYPLMWLIIPYFSNDSVRNKIKEKNNFLFVVFLLLVPIIITIADLIWAPGLCERYRLDLYYVVGILVFMLIGYRYTTAPNAKVSAATVNCLAIVSSLIAILLFLGPNDANYTYLFPEKLEEIKHVLFFMK